MTDETGELVTVTLPVEDWARLRECLETFAGYAETNARQVAALLQTHAGEAAYQPDRTSWQRDQVQYLTLAHDARRIKRMVGRRVDARTGTR
jgi:hypothetical protein